MRRHHRRNKRLRCVYKNTAINRAHRERVLVLVLKLLKIGITPLRADHAATAENEGSVSKKTVSLKRS